MKRYFSALILLAIAGLSVLIFHQVRVVRTTREEIEAARRSRNEILARLDGARSKLAANAGGQGDSKAARDDTEADDPVALRNDARARERMQKRLGSLFRLHYAALYRKLGLSDEQIAQYERLRIEGFENLLDIHDTAQAQGVSLTDPAIQALFRNEMQRIQQAAVALLGDATMQTVVQYDRTTLARSVANTIAGDVYYTDAPLTATQGEQLTQIFARNSPGYQNGGIATLDDVDLGAALPQAQAILTPAQFTALQNYLAGRNSWGSLQGRIAALTSPGP